MRLSSYLRHEPNKCIIWCSKDPVEEITAHPDKIFVSKDAGIPEPDI